jgi:hypothetical protein
MLAISGICLDGAWKLYLMTLDRGIPIEFPAIINGFKKSAAPMISCILCVCPDPVSLCGHTTNSYQNYLW